MTVSNWKINISPCDKHFIYYSNQVRSFSVLSTGFNDCSFNISLTIFIVKFWYLTEGREIRFDINCLNLGQTSVSQHAELSVVNCINNPYKGSWEFTNARQVKHDSGLCMQMRNDYTNVNMVPCNEYDGMQLWDWN